MTYDPELHATYPELSAPTPGRLRPVPGERREQRRQAFAEMFLEIGTLYGSAWEQEEARRIRLGCEELGIPMGYGRVARTPLQLHGHEGPRARPSSPKLDYAQRPARRDAGERLNIPPASTTGARRPRRANRQCARAGYRCSKTSATRASGRTTPRPSRCG